MYHAVLISSSIKTLKDFNHVLNIFCHSYEIITATRININEDLRHPLDFISINEHNPFLHLYEESDQKKINVLIPGDKNFFVAEFRAFEAFRLFMNALLIHTDLIIGNDNECFYTKAEFLQIETFDQFVGPED